MGDMLAPNPDIDQRFSSVASVVNHQIAPPSETSFLSNERLGVLCALFIALLVFFPNLDGTLLWDDDEGFYASTAQEMFQRNEWLVPYFNGELFGHKPPWMYWMMMVGFSIFGVNEFGARFFSAVFACVAVGLLYQLGRLLFSPRVGLIAAMIFSTSPMFTVVGRSATPDAYLVCFTLASLYFYVLATRQSWLPAPSTQPLPWFYMASLYSVMGLGALTKGPIAILFPGLLMLVVEAMNQLQYRESRESKRSPASLLFRTAICPRVWLQAIFRLRPITGLAMILLVAGPWYLAVGWKTGWEFHREFFGVHHFQRATQAMEGHAGSLLYYPISVLVGMFPWTVAVTPVIIYWAARFFQRRPNSQPVGLRRDTDVVDSKVHSNPGSVQWADFGLGLVSIWSAVYLVVFSLAATKLPNYVLPAYPAFALIFAIAFDAWLRQPNSYSRVWHQGVFAVLIATGLLIIAAVPIMKSLPLAKGGLTVFEKLELAPGVQQRLLWLSAIGIPSVLGGIFASIAMRRNRAQLAYSVYSLTGILTALCLWNVVAPRLTELQNPQQTFLKLRQREGSNSLAIASYDYFRPSMVFYSAARVNKTYTTNQVEDFFSEFPNGYLFIEASRIDELPMKARNLDIVERAARFPERGEWLLLRIGGQSKRQHKTDNHGFANENGCVTAFQTSRSAGVFTPHDRTRCKSRAAILDVSRMADAAMAGDPTLQVTLTLLKYGRGENLENILRSLIKWLSEVLSPQQARDLLDTIRVDVMSVNPVVGEEKDECYVQGNGLSKKT